MRPQAALKDARLDTMLPRSSGYVCLLVFAAAGRTVCGQDLFSVPR